MIDRREILKMSMAAILSPSWRSSYLDRVLILRENEAPIIRRYRPLGNTGLAVSDVCFGVAVSTDPNLLVDAFHRGVNYFDIVPSYSWSVEMLARAFAIEPRMRKEAIIASKAECSGLFKQIFSRPMGEAVLKCSDEILRKLGRDHIDIMQIHGVGERGAEDLDMLDPNTKSGNEVAKFFEILKNQGKMRFAGISSHGPYKLEYILSKAITSGRFEMVMTALNFMHSPGLQQALESAEKREVGVIAMKVLANAKGLKIKAAGGEPFSHAAISWALRQPGVNGVVITIPDREHLDEYLAASGRQFSFFDRTRLALFRYATSHEYCRVGCGLCIGSCPNGVAMPSMLRIDQYRRDYGLLNFARRQYRSFPKEKRPYFCRSCRTVDCAGSCPFGVPIRSRLLAAGSYLDPAFKSLS